MTHYKYKAKTAAGADVSGVIHADSSDNFIKQLKEQNLYLISYKEEDENAGSADLNANKKLPLKQVTVFCRQMASLLRVGVSLVKAIDILYQQTTHKAMKESLQKLYEGVQKGNLLSESLRKQTNKFPPIMINLIESGEASGTLDVVMDKLASQFESDLKLKNKITSSMMYPIILCCLGIGVVILLVIVVLPRFMDMFRDAGIEKLPLPTAMIIGFSDFVTSYWYILLFVILAAIVSFQVYVNTAAGRMKWDEFKFKIPLVKNICSKLAVVRFCRTFSTLFSSGIPMLQSLSIVMKVVNNEFVAAQLAETSEDIRKGVSLTHAVRRVTVFPPLVQSMISIGEESGSLDTMLKNAGEYFNDELENSIAKMVALIEPIMIVAIAVVVAFIIVAILMPMMEIYNAAM